MHNHCILGSCYVTQLSSLQCCNMCFESPAVCSPPLPLFFFYLPLSSTKLLSTPSIFILLLLFSSSPHLLSASVSPLPESMILLGSIERAQLQSLLSQQLGRPRRLEYIRERAVAEKKRLSVVSNPGSEDGGQRVSQEVRFQVRSHCKWTEEMWWDTKQLLENTLGFIIRVHVVYSAK